MADTVPQALMITAIVIGVAVTAATLFLHLIPSKITTILSSFVYIFVVLSTLAIFYRTRFLGEIITTKTSADFLGITLYCDLTASVFLFKVLEALVILIFLSRDLFNIYVAVEVSSIVCAVLIMFKRESRAIYDGLVYLLINIVGMLFF